MIIDKVTITGADNSVDPQDLAAISTQFPHVEWAILLSKSNFGTERFPDKKWLASMKEVWSANPFMRMSGHICGQWVRDICAGNWSIFEQLDLDMFERLQLNFHGLQHDTTGMKEGCIAVLDKIQQQIIFQIDEINYPAMQAGIDAGLSVAALFDMSHGEGVLPESWPSIRMLQEHVRSNRSIYCGYAGGLSPENLQQQLPLIEQAVGSQTIWIDVETKVRTDSNFDLTKVVSFLEHASPWVRECYGFYMD